MPKLINKKKNINISKVNSNKTQIKIHCELKGPDSLGFYQIYEKDRLVYNGQINNLKQKEGKGLLIFKDGSRFKGFFSNDKMLEGILTQKSSTYQGKFNNQQPEGQGILTFQNGEQYQGQFLKGKYNGQGKYLSLKGEIRIMNYGNWINGQREGQFDTLTMDFKYNQSSMLLKIEYQKSMRMGISFFQGNLQYFGINELKNIKVQSMIKETTIEQAKEEYLQMKSLYLNIQDYLNNYKNFQYDDVICTQENSKSQEIINNIQEFNKNKVMLNDKLANFIVGQQCFLEHEKQTCSICQVEIEKEEKISLFPCQRHLYHTNCLKSWTDQGKKTCPTCRFDLGAININQVYGEGENINIKIDPQQLIQIQKQLDGDFDEKEFEFGIQQHQELQEELLFDEIDFQKINNSCSMEIEQEEEQIIIKKQISNQQNFQLCK